MAKKLSEIDCKVNELLADLTVEEKVAQISSVLARDLLEGGEFSEAKAEEIMSDGMGQVTRVGGNTRLEPQDAAELADEIQQFLKSETEHGIPAMIHEECLCGYMGPGGTTYPQSIGMASSWEPSLVKEITSETRKQLKAIGYHHALAPVLDVARDLRWGRVEETYGEDPYLVAEFGKNFIEGLQCDNPKEGIYATVKHLGGHSVSEGGRNHCPANVSERELRENFFYPFEVAVKEAGVEAVMNAYHDIDGMPCASSKELLTDILRGEWGFDGIVVSDYSSIRMLHTDHHVAKSKQEAAIMALEAGIDVELPFEECYDERLVEAVNEGLVSEAVLDQAVKRHLKSKYKKGLFTRNLSVKEDDTEQYFETPEQRKLARKAARESIVLLKNEGELLPLDKEFGSLAVIGPNADSAQNMLGDYAYGVHAEEEEEVVPVVTVLEGIKEKLSDSTGIRYEKGCEVKGNSKEGFDRAREAAEKSDLAVVVVGTKSGLIPPETQLKDHPETTGEGSDRVDLQLPGVQNELLKEIYETGTPVIAVLINGRPLATAWLQKNAPAIVEGWLPGEEGGRAVADVLFGDHNPGGKLPVTIPKSVGQLPMHYNRKRISHERHYVFEKNEPLYPFGFGLSYTKFEYSELEIKPDKAKSASKVKISCRVINSGSRAGKEVVQLYIRDKYASLTRPVKELKGFKKLSLEPGEAKKICFTVPAELLSFYDENMNLVVEPGLFEVMIGKSSEDIELKGEFEIVGEKKQFGRGREYFSKTEVM